MLAYEEEIGIGPISVLLTINIIALEHKRSWIDLVGLSMCLESLLWPFGTQNGCRLGW